MSESIQSSLQCLDDFDRLVDGVGHSDASVVMHYFEHTLWSPVLLVSVRLLRSLESSRGHFDTVRNVPSGDKL